MPLPKEDSVQIVDGYSVTAHSTDIDTGEVTELLSEVSEDNQNTDSTLATNDVNSPLVTDVPEIDAHLMSQVDLMFPLTNLESVAVNNQIKQKAYAFITKYDGLSWCRELSSPLIREEWGVFSDNIDRIQSIIEDFGNNYTPGRTFQTYALDSLDSIIVFRLYTFSAKIVTAINDMDVNAPVLIALSYRFKYLNEITNPKNGHYMSPFGIISTFLDAF